VKRLKIERWEHEKCQTLYLSGSISNNPLACVDFGVAKCRLLKAGYRVVSPTDLHISKDKKLYQYAMKRAISEMMRCDGVAVIRGKDDSFGAITEDWLSRRLGMPCEYVDFWLEQKRLFLAQEGIFLASERHKTPSDISKAGKAQGKARRSFWDDNGK